MRNLWTILTTSLLAAFLANAAAAVTVNLSPVDDATIYEGNAGSDDLTTHSCGGGSGLFVGATNDGFRRRALLRFDVAGAIPGGATINGVQLTMVVDRTQDNQARTMTLHPLTTDWNAGNVICSTTRGGGQGANAANGDATWASAAHNQVTWSTAGGDFGATSATAAAPTTDGGAAVWTTNAALVNDVQTWLDSPGVNFGWIVLGAENATQTTRRFTSSSGGAGPVLTVDFTTDEELFACCSEQGDCSVTSTAACGAGGGTPDNALACDPNPCPQPTGACCNADETCGDNVGRVACEDAGGVFQGDGVACAAVTCGLEPFVDPLPVPSVLQPVGTREDGAPIYEVHMTQEQQQLHRDLPPTDVWTYQGTFPGPTLDLDANQTVEVRYYNDLPPNVGHYLPVDQCAHGPNYWQNTARTVVHVHGAHVPSRYDGQPELDFLPGEFDVYEYPNNQLPTTLWYHDHALGITRLNVYMGLAGFFLLRDDFERNLPLPRGPSEIPLVLQDRQFNANGTLFYPALLQNAFYGDKVLVNGKVWPFRNVRQGKYRFRLLNGSQARVYDLRLENQANPAQVIPFHLIGTDGGLIEAPIPLSTISMAPAERLDVVVDFESFPPGTEIILKNDETTVPLVENVMKFIVTNNNGQRGPLPPTLRPFTPIPEGAAAGTRKFRLQRVADECSGGQWVVQSLDDFGNVIGEHWDDITEYPTLGTTEIWEFENPTTMMHPMHVHLVMFQVLDKTDIETGDPIPREPWERNSWKDTVPVPPGSRVRVIMTFEDYVGKFAYHCHILDHEDHEMMRQFQTTSGLCNNNGLCEDGEDCVSCSDCGTTSGAFCGNGLCETGDGEDCSTCAADCAGGAGFCCGASVGCEDLRCISDGDYCRTMPRAEACCGDTLCEGQERTGAGFCGVDCGEELCAAGVTCPFFADGFETGDTSRWSTTVN